MKLLFHFLVILVSFSSVGQINQSSAMISAGATADDGGNFYSYNIGQTIFTTVEDLVSTLSATQGLLQPNLLNCIKHPLVKAGAAICGTSPVTLSLKSSPIYAEYKWYLLNDNNDALVVNGANLASYSPNSPGDYYMTYMGDFCVNSTEPISVELDAGISSPLIQFTDNVLSTVTAFGDSYQWYIEIDNKKYAIYGQVKSSYTPIFDGSYYVEVTYGTGGCRVMSDLKVIDFSGRPISNGNIVFSGNTVALGFAQEAVLNVYPYPSFESFTIDLLSDYIGLVNVKLLDMNGRQVSEQNMLKKGLEFSESITTEGLPEGLYGVVVSTDVGTEVTKMLIVE